MKPRPRIMVLGGSPAQVRTIRRARERGCFVVVADRNPGAVGVCEADLYVEASIFDEEAIARAALDSGVESIVVVATDQPVLVAARVCARLGLRFPLSPDAALLATHKGRMKARLAELGVATPGYTVVDETAAVLPGCPGVEELSAPFVVKPVDNQGQRGVSLVRRSADLPRAVRAAAGFSRQREVLVEEYYPSAEITVSGWVGASGPVILTATDRVTIPREPSLGVCAAHRFPGVTAEGQEGEIAELVQAIIQGFGIARGPFYIQILRGEAGLKVNEVACRLGGAFEELSIPLVTATSPIDLVLDDALGIEPDLPPCEGETPSRSASPLFAPAGGAFLVALLYCRPGTIAHLGDLARARLVAGVEAVEWVQKEGTAITPMRDSSQRVGYAVLGAAGRAEANTRLARLFRELSIRDEDGEEMLLDTLSLSLFPESTLHETRHSGPRTR